MENTFFRLVKCFTPMVMIKLKQPQLPRKPHKFKLKMANKLMLDKRRQMLDRLKQLNNKQLQQNSNHRLNNKSKLMLKSINQPKIKLRHKLLRKLKLRHKPKLRQKHKHKLKHRPRHRQKLRPKLLLKLKQLNQGGRQIFRFLQQLMLTKPQLSQQQPPNLFPRRNHSTR